MKRIWKILELRKQRFPMTDHDVKILISGSKREIVSCTVLMSLCDGR